MSGGEFVFLFFAAIAVFSAIATITRRNPVVAAVWLIATFFSVAVCYVLLRATFLGAIQVLVYAGAIMVLFIFVIMVLDVDEAGLVSHRYPSRIARAGYYGTALAGCAFLAWVFTGTLARQYVTVGAEISQPEFGTALGMGRALFREYLFAFEAVSLLLLAAVIGAVVVARNRREREREANLSGMITEHRVAAGLDPAESIDSSPSPTPFTDFGEPSAGGHDGGT